MDKIVISLAKTCIIITVGIPIGTNCAFLVADFFCCCYERELMLSLSDNNPADFSEAFNSSSRYLDDLLKLMIQQFKQMEDRYIPLNSVK